MPDGPCIYGPCATCGSPVIVAKTSEGVQKILDTQQPCWALGWARKDGEPTAFPSRAYPEHHCPA